ncbi:hypothetical protein EV361DRAFT_950156 [Lentinula raphanica]|nr:hypothetical protein F5880DRAFT_1611456 [Lentinula raphanica]KAJ3970928.1 hypothetical protein EV361DRAFT_950156 [Lentinula raphanica]
MLNVYSIHKIRTSQAVQNPPIIPLALELPLPLNPVVLNFLFAQHYEITNDTEWATLIPDKGTHVHLPSHHSSQEFEVALYHDLHCLNIIRSVFVSMRDGSTAHSPEAEQCLGTIRQAILCTADVTLEPAELVCYDDDESDGGLEEEEKEWCTNVGPEASGNNVDHRCRDWVQVREFVQKNQKNQRNQND